MKIEYKEYPRMYEKVFTSEECLNKFSLDNLSTDYPGGKDKYIEKFKSFAYGFERLFFTGMLQYQWLKRRFIYFGVPMNRLKSNFITADSGYATFVKHRVNFNYQMFTTTFFFNKIITYFDDFFPDFDEHNPFEEPEYFKYPYEYVSTAHLVLVYQMDERMDLLKKAEEEKMTYYEFLDFVLNYTLCVNDDLGKTVYTFRKPKVTNQFPPYVQYHFRDTRRRGSRFHFRVDSETKKKVKIRMRKKNYE